MPENTSFAFVTNLLDVNCNLPFKIIEDCYFQKADSIQIDQIKKYLSDSGHFSDFFKFNLSPYELVYIEDTNTDKNKIFKSQQLEPQNWKYYILTFSGNNSKISDLAKAANLLDTELEFGLHFIYYEYTRNFGIQINPTHIFNYFHEMKNRLPLIETNAVGVCERGVRRTWEVGLKVAILKRVCNNSPVESL
ncbi:hypothetical protein [Nostoc sp.]|uniref:hypothetical protein n=1 Tax=Nostoc sp. TaxID=1180 RepID=UPI002FFB5A71